MVKARKIGIIAALGSSTAALAMLTGLAGARADELQLNQQLLDQRIDQIAAGQGAGGGGNDQFSVTRTRQRVRRSRAAASRGRSSSRARTRRSRYMVR